MKKSEVKIGNEVITEVYNYLGDLIIVKGKVIEIHDKYCIALTEKGYKTCINFDGEMI